MPHRKLVQIGKPSPAPPVLLPTVAEYFRELVQKQGEDIRLLKERALAFANGRASRKAEAARRKSTREESWRLHPVMPSANASSEKGAPKKKRAARKKTTPQRRAR